MFPSPLSQCFDLKRRLFCPNQRNFVYRLPIKIFYFEDFQWSFFGKMLGQKQRFFLPRMVIFFTFIGSLAETVGVIPCETHKAE